MRAEARAHRALPIRPPAARASCVANSAPKSRATRSIGSLRAARQQRRLRRASAGSAPRCNAARARHRALDLGVAVPSGSKKICSKLTVAGRMKRAAFCARYADSSASVGAARGDCSSAMNSSFWRTRRLTTGSSRSRPRPRPRGTGSRRAPSCRRGPQFLRRSAAAASAARCWRARSSTTAWVTTIAPAVGVTGADAAVDHEQQQRRSARKCRAVRAAGAGCHARSRDLRRLQPGVYQIGEVKARSCGRHRHLRRVIFTLKYAAS